MTERSLRGSVVSPRVASVAALVLQPPPLLLSRGQFWGARHRLSVPLSEELPKAAGLGHPPAPVACHSGGRWRPERGHGAARRGGESPGGELRFVRFGRAGCGLRRPRAGTPPPGCASARLAPGAAASKTCSFGAGNRPNPGKVPSRSETIPRGVLGGGRGLLLPPLPFPAAGARGWSCSSPRLRGQLGRVERVDRLPPAFVPRFFLLCRGDVSPTCPLLTVLETA